TGKNPANLGAFGWSRIGWEEKTFRTLRFSFSEELEVWNYLNAGGFSAGVINMPLTYPPKVLDGFMVSGPLTPGEKKEYTYPKDLKEKLRRKYDYKIFPKLTFALRDILEGKDIVRHMKENIHTKFEVAREFSQRVDFLQLTIFLTDNLQHRIWNRKGSEEIWKLIDKEIGEIIRENPEKDILIMSDHGMEKAKTYFNLSAWLQKHGYCSSKGKKKGDALSKLGITRRRLLNLIRRLNLGTPLKKFLRLLPYKVARETFRRVPEKSGGEELDWDESKVIPSGTMLYLNPSLDNKQEMKEHLREELLKIKSPESGEKIIKTVYEKEEVFQGKYSDIAPDLAVIPADGVWIGGGVGEEMWGEDLTYWIADHIQDGIFLGYGPNIKEGKEIKGSQLIDLAPTILHAFGLPVPDSMDGKVLKEIFKDESKPGKTPVEHQKAEVPKKEIKRKIRKLKRKGKI
ncbi:hypothetical protein AKJ45_03360, partial [candidate division MSBL1 archaeon SCGC-AAA261F19]